MSEFSPTRVELLAVYRAPVVQVESICEKYLNLSWHTAKARAALNLLPFPTFRMGDSRKAPLLVRVGDLAEYIDKQRDEAQREWALSQA
jgi:hypothetical protein